MNLLQETIEELEGLGKSPKDVLWVGCIKDKWSDYEVQFNGVISWEEFVKIADIEYNEDFGMVEISLDLVIVGNDWWLERNEYDGSECWAFKVLPRKKYYMEKEN